MNLADLQKLSARGEDSRLQYKLDVRNVDALAAEMAAFANCEGGRILIGVTDHGELTGLSRAEVGRMNQLISNAASQHVRSPISPQTEKSSTMPSHLSCATSTRFRLGGVSMLLDCPKYRKACLRSCW